MAQPGEVSVLIPAFNEAEGIGAVVTAVAAAAPWREIIVVDDGSTDGTGEVATSAGARVVRHPYNKGNGASVKSGVRHATGEYILILDADGQHRPADARRLTDRLGDYDLVVGARSSATQAGSSRRWGNAALNRLASYLTERRIPDLTSGFRAARRAHVLEFLHLLPNGFSTPTTTTLAFIKAGYNVAFEPIDAAARVGTSKIRFSRDGAKFFLIILRIITIFSPLRIFVPVAAASFTLGTAYGLWNFATQQKIANGAVILILFAVMVFFVGLISEQISALRFDGRR
jgi:glycosyltransferase involved in cell wall biosynthesis